MSDWPFGTGSTEAHQDSTRPTLRLVTFGGPALIAGAKSFALSPLRAALLGLLATAPYDGLSTARVIDLLWKPGPSSRLRHRISQLIYALNRELPEKVVVKKRHRHNLSKTVVTDY